MKASNIRLEYAQTHTWRGVPGFLLKQKARALMTLIFNKARIARHVQAQAHAAAHAQTAHERLANNFSIERPRDVRVDEMLELGGAFRFGRTGGSRIADTRNTLRVRRARRWISPRNCRCSRSTSLASKRELAEGWLHEQKVTPAARRCMSRHARRGTSPHRRPRKRAHVRAPFEFVDA